MSDTNTVAEIFRTGGYPPPHPLEVDDTIDLPNLAGVVVRGTGASFAGNLGSRLVWTGPADRPMFVFRNCRESSFSDFLVDAQRPLSKVFLSLSESDRPNSHSTYGCIWRGVKINGRMQVGTGWSYEHTAQDWNNSEMTWYDCFVDSALVGWHRDHEQAKAHRWVNCGGHGRERPGSVCISGTSSIGVWGLNASGYDWVFALKGPNDYCDIDNVNAEGNLGLIKTGATEALGTMDLRNVRFGLNRTPKGATFASIGWAGPIRITSMGIYGATDAEAYIDLASWGKGAQAYVADCIFRTTRFPVRYQPQQRITCERNAGGVTGGAGTWWPNVRREGW